jgi:uncharacterized OB-fold protein
VVDLTRPCGKCGNVDRYSNGRCKSCHKTSLAKYRQSDKGRAKIRACRQSDKVRQNRNLTKPCGKCGEIDRYSNGRCKPCQKKSLAKYNQSDEGRAKRRDYNRHWRQPDESRAKAREYQRHYRQLDEVRAKQREHKRKQRQTAIGRQRYLAAQAKHKKTLFEFSLQNQQKVIEQCQQKLTQPNETN